MWSVGTILNGLLSFMTDTAQVLSFIEHDEAAKACLEPDERDQANHPDECRLQAA